MGHILVGTMVLPQPLALPVLEEMFSDLDVPM